MIRVEVDFRALDAGLDILKSRASDPRPGFKKAVEAARIIEGRWFDDEGGGRWAMLAKRTQKARGRDGRLSGYYKESRGLRKGEGHAHRILHWTHRLRKSLTIKGAKGAIAKPVGKDGFEFGTRYTYKGKPIAFWLDRGNRKMKPRRLLPRVALGKTFARGLAKHVTVKELGMS